MAEHSGVRASAVALAAIIATALCVLLLRGWQELGHDLPDVPWIATGPLGLLILLVLLSGWQVRRYVRFRRTDDTTSRPPQWVSPERARGTLVAAQAAALGGGVLIGWYLAIVLLQLPNADVASVRGMVIRAAVSAGVSLLLAVAGLLAQHWCRLPPGQNDDEDDGPPQGVSYVS